MMYNPLDQWPGARKALYLVQWLYNGALTLSGAVWVINQTPLDQTPMWYLYLAGLGPVLWTYLGFTAQTNVTENPPPPEDEDE